jgi:CPA2 family monovalent cation:H+ antiporter-2
VRRDRYRMLRGFFHGEALLEEVPPGAYRERLHSVTLPPEAYAIDKELRELRLDTLGVSVSAVRRGGKQSHKPSPHTRFMAGDVLVLYGTPEALEGAERVLLEG